jgi:type II restriction endonuclease TdeIII
MPDNINPKAKYLDMLPFLPSRLNDVPSADRLEAYRHLAALLARQKYGFAATGHLIKGLIRLGQLKRIEAIVNREGYEFKTGLSDIAEWDENLKYIRAGRGNYIPVHVFVDVYVEDKTANKSYGFIFTTRANTQMEAFSTHKRIRASLIKLNMMQPLQIDEVYAVLPATPFQDSVSSRYWFQADNKPITIFADEFWKKWAC